MVPMQEMAMNRFRILPRTLPKMFDKGHGRTVVDQLLVR